MTHESDISILIQRDKVVTQAVSAAFIEAAEIAEKSLKNTSTLDGGVTSSAAWNISQALRAKAFAATREPK